MPALRGAQGIARATRAPEGASLPRPHGPQIYREVPLWPGIAWGRDARCACSWAVRYGVMQVKVQSSACTVHVPGRAADPWPAQCAPAPGDPTDDDLLAAIRAGAVTREMYAAAAAAWREQHAASLAAAALGPLIGGALEAVGEGDRRGTARCGTRGGYNRHWLDGTRTCPACRAAKCGAPPAASEAA